MPKRCIGLDIGPGYLRAVQITAAAEGFRIDRLFAAQTRRATDSVPAILRSLFEEHRFDRRAAVAASLPHDAVFFRNIQADESDRDRFRCETPPSFRSSFPIPPDRVLALTCSSCPSEHHPGPILTAAADRASLAALLETLSHARIRPRLVDAPVFALLSTIAVNYPQIASGRALVLYLGPSLLTLLVTDEARALIVRNIPVPPASATAVDSIAELLADVITHEARITWQKALASPIDQHAEVYLVAADSRHTSLAPLIDQALNCSTTLVDPAAALISACREKPDPSYSTAIGLALRPLAPERTAGVNFLEADRADASSKLNLKKEIITHSALVAAIAVVLLLGLFLRLSRMEAAYAGLKSRINQVFQAAVPEENNIVSPLAQLQEKLDSLRSDQRLFASLAPAVGAPLQVLRTLTATAPAQAKVEIDDLLIAPQLLRMTGTCSSFEALYQWQRALQNQPGFDSLEVTDIQKLSDSGLVRFTMSVSSPIEEHR